MSLKKQHLKSKPVCKVTFRLDKEIASGADSASVVGDFNDWTNDANQMTKLKNGSFKITLDLESGRAYQFRYLLDNGVWANDGEADGYVRSSFGDSENCVVEV